MADVVGLEYTRSMVVGVVQWFEGVGRGQEFVRLEEREKCDYRLRAQWLRPGPSVKHREVIECTPVLDWEVQMDEGETDW